MIVVVIAVLGGVFLSLGYVNPYSEHILLSELVLQLSGSRGNLNLGFSMNELLSLAIRMLPDFVLEMYFGIWLYRHFCTASVYVFSRYTKRVRWYFKELFSLGKLIFFYEILLLLITILVSMYRYQVSFDEAGIILFGYQLVIRSIWIFGVTLFINLLALFVGSDFGSMCVLGGQALGITLLGVVNTNVNAGNLLLESVWIKWNLIARLVLCWQSSNIQALKNILKPPYLGLELEETVVIYICACVVIVVIGAIIVKKKELINTMTEEGEM